MSVIFHKGYAKECLLTEAKDAEELESFRRMRKIPNKIHLIFGGVGSGKSILTERMAHDLHHAGYTVLIFTGKRGNEHDFGYSMMQPEQEYHLRILQEQEEVPEAKQVLFYHPLTTMLPKKKNTVKMYQEIPEHNFYSFPLNALSSDALKALFPSDNDGIAVATTQQIMEKISENETLIDFSWKCFEALNKEQNKDLVSINEENNYIPVSSMGTIATLKLILNSFAMFNKHPFIRPIDDAYNLDMEKVVNDQEKYHIFVNKWLPRELKYFDLICRLDALEKVLSEEKAKHPICVIFEEIETLLPDSHKTKYEEELANRISNFLADARVKGVTTICNTQNYFKTDTSFRSKATETRIMKCSNDDRARLLKDFPEIGSENLKRIVSFKPGDYFLWEKIKEGIVFRARMPTHAHAEEGNHFFEIMKRRMPEKMKDYTEHVYTLQQERQELLDKSREKAQQIIEAMGKTEKADKPTNQDRKLEQTVEQLRFVKQKIKENKKLGKEHLMKRCYEIKKRLDETESSPHKKSWYEVVRKIQAEIVGQKITHKTAKSLAMKYAEKTSDMNFGMQHQSEIN